MEKYLKVETYTRESNTINGKKPFLDPENSQFKEITDSLFKNEAAAIVLGCAPSTLKLSRHTGTLLGAKAPEYIKRGKRNVVYRQSTLETWLDQFDEQANTACDKGLVQ